MAERRNEAPDETLLPQAEYLVTLAASSGSARLRSAAARRSGAVRLGGQRTVDLRQSECKLALRAARWVGAIVPELADDPQLFAIPPFCPLLRSGMN